MSESEKNNYYSIDALNESNSKPNTFLKLLSQWLDDNTEEIDERIETIVSEIESSTVDGEKLLRCFLHDIITDCLVYIDKAEREHLSKRQAEGIKAARERGVHFGRQKKEVPTEFYPMYFRYRKGELSSRKCGEELNVSHSTFLKWVREVDEMSENINNKTFND